MKSLTKQVPTLFLVATAFSVQLVSGTATGKSDAKLTARNQWFLSQNENDKVLFSLHNKKSSKENLKPIYTERKLTRFLRSDSESDSSSEENSSTLSSRTSTSRESEDTSESKSRKNTESSTSAKESRTSESDEDKEYLTACIGPYPGYKSCRHGRNPSGEVTLTFDVGGSFQSKTSGDYPHFDERLEFSFAYALRGLKDHCKNCLLSINEGMSCERKKYVGRHHWNDRKNAPDPWTVKLGAVYNSNNNGKAEGAFSMYNGYGHTRNNRRVVVVYDENRERIGCGILARKEKGRCVKSGKGGKGKGKGGGKSSKGKGKGGGKHSKGKGKSKGKGSKSKCVSSSKSKGKRHKTKKSSNSMSDSSKKIRAHTRESNGSRSMENSQKTSNASIGRHEKSLSHSVSAKETAKSASIYKEHSTDSSKNEFKKRTKKIKITKYKSDSRMTGKSKSSKKGKRSGKSKGKWGKGKKTKQKTRRIDEKNNLT